MTLRRGSSIGLLLLASLSFGCAKNSSKPSSGPNQAKTGGSNGPSSKPVDGQVLVTDLANGAEFVVLKDLEEAETYVLNGTVRTLSQMLAERDEYPCSIKLPKTGRTSGTVYRVEKVIGGVSLFNKHGYMRSGLRVKLSNGGLLDMPEIRLESKVSEAMQRCLGGLAEFRASSPLVAPTQSPAEARLPEVFKFKNGIQSEIMGQRLRDGSGSVEVTCAREYPFDNFRCQFKGGTFGMELPVTESDANALADRHLRMSEDRLRAEGRLSVSCETSEQVCVATKIDLPDHVASKLPPRKVTPDPVHESAPIKRHLFKSELKPAGETHDPYEEVLTAKEFGRFKMTPIIRDKNFAILVPHVDERVRGTETIPVVKVDNEGTLISSIEVDQIQKGDFVQHQIRRGALLKNGNMLLVGWDGSNVNGAYRFGYIKMVDSQLKDITSFGNNSIFVLGDTRSKYNYRFIIKVQELGDGSLLGLERRMVREGEPDYNTAPELCFNFKVRVSGKLDKNFGKNGFKAVKCP